MISKTDALPIINMTTATRTELVDNAIGPSGIITARDEYNRSVGLLGSLFYFSGDGRRIDYALDFPPEFTLFVVAESTEHVVAFGAAEEALSVVNHGDGTISIWLNGTETVAAVGMNLYCVSMSSSGLITLNGSPLSTVDVVGFAAPTVFSIGKIAGGIDNFYKGRSGIVQLLERELTTNSVIDEYNKIAALYPELL